jgi:hypothetical protein
MRASAWTVAGVRAGTGTWIPALPCPNIPWSPLIPQLALQGGIALPFFCYPSCSSNIPLAGSTSCR